MSEFNPPQHRQDIAERGFFERIQLTHGRSNLRRRTKQEREQFPIIFGVDAAYSKNDVIAVATSIDCTNGNLLEYTEYRDEATFPYVPGLFFLREGPFVCESI